jgi:hypothetical protein
MSLINKVTDVKNSSKTVLTNVLELLEAISLVTVSIYALWAGYYHYKLHSLFDILLFSAGIVIAFMGASLLVKHLNKR